MKRQSTFCLLLLLEIDLKRHIDGDTDLGSDCSAAEDVALGLVDAVVKGDKDKEGVVELVLASLDLLDEAVLDDSREPDVWYKAKGQGERYVSRQRKTEAKKVSRQRKTEVKKVSRQRKTETKMEREKGNQKINQRLRQTKETSRQTKKGILTKKRRWEE